MVSHSYAGFDNMRRYDSHVRECYTLCKVTLNVMLLGRCGFSETFSTSLIFKEPQTISYPGFSYGPHVSGSFFFFFFFCE